MTKLYFTPKKGLALFAALALFTFTPLAQGRWQHYRKLLAAKAPEIQPILRKHHWDKGTWHILFITEACGDCNGALQKMKAYCAARQCVVVTADTPEQAAQIKSKYGLPFPVVALTAEDFLGLGPVILPTMLQAQNGKPRFAADVLEGLPK